MDLLWIAVLQFIKQFIHRNPIQTGTHFLNLFPISANVLTQVCNQSTWITHNTTTMFQLILIPVLAIMLNHWLEFNVQRTMKTKLNLIFHVSIKKKVYTLGSILVLVS